MSEPNVRQILFLSQHAVRQRGFINAFFVKAKELVPKSLILHETGVDDPKVNWFVSKRISGGLSEQMIPNNALYTERTKHKVENGDGLELDVNRVVKEMANVTALVDNPVAWHAQTQQPKAIETSIWLSTMHNAFPDAEVLFSRITQSQQLGSISPWSIPRQMPEH